MARKTHRSKPQSESKIGRLIQLLNGSNRNKALAGLLFGVLAVTGIFSLALVSRSNSSQSVDLVASPQEETERLETANQTMALVTVIDGTVEHKEADTWEPATEDTDIKAGSSLRTIGAASRAEVQLLDGSAIRIDAASEIIFETLTESRIVILQEKGHVYSRITPSGSRSYAVLTENAQFQSEGTAFRTTSTGDEESVEVFHSSVREVQSNLSASQGEKIIIKNFGSPDKNNTIEKINLQNIKEDRFISWNREQDLADDNHNKLLGFLADYTGPVVTISKPAANSTIETGADSNTGSVQITGTAVDAVSLSIQAKSLANSNPINVDLGDDGAFTTPDIKSPLGQAIFELVAVDSAGNKTYQTVSYTVEAEASVQEQGIVLTSTPDSESSEVMISWGLVGMTTSDGVRIVTSNEPQPIYPEHSLFDTATNDKSATLIRGTDLSDGEAHYVRVCRYNKNSDSCDAYSNEITIEPR